MAFKFLQVRPVENVHFSHGIPKEVLIKVCVPVYVGRYNAGNDNMATGWTVDEPSLRIPAVSLNVQTGYEVHTGSYSTGSEVSFCNSTTACALSRTIISYCSALCMYMYIYSLAVTVFFRVLELNLSLEEYFLATDGYELLRSCPQSDKQKRWNIFKY
jgi:hypothetical protein